MQVCEPYDRFNVIYENPECQQPTVVYETIQSTEYI